jgi:hypothetical protein
VYEHEATTEIGVMLSPTEQSMEQLALAEVNRYITKKNVHFL